MSEEEKATAERLFHSNPTMTVRSIASIMHRSVTAVTKHLQSVGLNVGRHRTLPKEHISEEEVAARIAEVQSRWSEKDRRARSSYKTGPLTVVTSTMSPFIRIGNY